MKKTKFLKLFILLLIPIFTLLSFTFQNEDDDFDLIKNLEIYHAIFKELRINYVDEVNVANLITYSIEQMLKQLDPFTIYYPENKVEDYTFMNTGEYGGIGATVEKIDNKFIVTDIILNMCADKAGIQIGNEIVEIETNSLINKSLEDINILLRGEPGSEINIKLLNAENKKIEKTLTREKIQTKNVSYSNLINENIAYVKLENFMFNASQEVAEAIEEMNKKNKIQGVIIDLRSNPGGLLTEAVNIVNLFVPKNTEIVKMKGQAISSNKTFYTNYEPFSITVPVIVLINSRSASASEIVAGALQDLDRAVVIGQRSYGKGLVQLTKDLAYNTKLKITMAKYYIPSGRCVQANDAVTRDKNHKIINIPDSVINKFLTKNGRNVYDGAGIYPDIYIPESTDHEFIDSLNSNFVFFKFAYNFHKTNPTIENAETFTIQDDTYNQFVEFTKTNFVFYSSTNQKIAELEKELQLEDNKNEQITQKFQEIQTILKTQETQYLEKYKTNIINLLGQEIIKQYYFKEGYIEYDLKNADEIKKAIEILTDINTYNKLLKND